MEHLTCLTPDDLFYFIEVTQMVYDVQSDRVLLTGERVFTWLWDEARGLFCFDEGEMS